MEGLPALGRLCTTDGLLNSYNKKTYFNTVLLLYEGQTYEYVIIKVSSQCNMFAKFKIASGACMKRI